MWVLRPAIGMCGLSLLLNSAAAMAQDKLPAAPAQAAPARPSAAPASDDPVSRGDAAYLARDADAAIAAYREALARDANSARLHYRLGQAHVAKADLAEADKAYTEALRLAKEDSGLRAKLMFVLADLRERQKNHDAALTAWTKYEDLGKERSDARIHAQTAAERKKRLTDYKKLVTDYAAVKARIEKRLQEADQRARRSAQ